MRKTAMQMLTALLIALSLAGCLHTGARNHEQVPSMLDQYTAKAEAAVLRGKTLEGDILDYAASKNPNVSGWFEDEGYTLRAGVVGGHAVVLVCAGDKALFEDTYCAHGTPDRDFSAGPEDLPCAITMTEQEVSAVCQ